MAGKQPPAVLPVGIMPGSQSLYTIACVWTFSCRLAFACLSIPKFSCAQHVVIVVIYLKSDYLAGLPFSVLKDLPLLFHNHKYEPKPCVPRLLARSGDSTARIWHVGNGTGDGLPLIIKDSDTSAPPRKRSNNHTRTNSPASRWTNYHSFAHSVKTALVDLKDNRARVIRVQAKARCRNFLAIWFIFNPGCTALIPPAVKSSLILANYSPPSRSNAVSSPRKPTTRNCFVLSHDSKPSAGAAPEADGKNTKDVTTLDWKVRGSDVVAALLWACLVCNGFYLCSDFYFCLLVVVVLLWRLLSLQGGSLCPSPRVQSDGSALATGCYDGRARVWSKGGECTIPLYFVDNLHRCVYLGVSSVILSSPLLVCPALQLRCCGHWRSTRGRYLRSSGTDLVSDWEWVEGGSGGGAGCFHLSLVTRFS